MRQSELFTKTRKEAPKDEVAKNAQLLIRAGFIHKEMAGVYSYLPLGLRVLKKIENIIREEMNAIGGQEVFLSALHPKENWEKTGRWESMDDLYKIQDSSGREFALGATHEEILVPLVAEFVSSYRDLPKYIYQIQNKFRMELRAKSGILRGREFIMKDLYSFHTSVEDLEEYYERAKGAYKNIFNRAGIGDKTFVTSATGGTFSKYSDEFQTLCESGEDIIHVCHKCRMAINDEIFGEKNVCPSCGNADLTKEKSVEVGNIFNLGDGFSKPFGLTYKDESGESKPVVMGCYGIGLGRLMGTVVEVLSDEKGIVWPEEIAPFKIHLISLAGTNEEVTKEAERVYEDLSVRGVEVLFDDRDVRAGEKFADSDLIGVPQRVVVSENSIAEGGVEVTQRGDGTTEIVHDSEIISRLAV